MKKGFIALLTILFFCNFGRVEYSALNPKATTVELDSTFKTTSSTSTKVSRPTEQEQEQETAEASEENFGWSNYIVLGIKTFFATLLKILVA
jgi:hypothetical protein